MPKYHVTGKLAFSHTKTRRAKFERVLNQIVEADDGTLAEEYAVDEEILIATDAAHIMDYENVDEESDIHRYATQITVTSIDETDPEYQRQQNEQTMRALGPQVAPPLLEVKP